MIPAIPQMIPIATNGHPTALSCEWCRINGSASIAFRSDVAVMAKISALLAKDAAAEQHPDRKPA